MGPGCDDILALIAASEAVALSDDSKHRVHTHMDSCEQCRRKYSTMVAVGLCLASSAAEDLPPEITDAEIEARVRAGVAAANAQDSRSVLQFRPAKPRRIRTPRIFAFLGVTAAAACLAIFLLLPDQSEEKVVFGDMNVLFRPGRATLGSSNDGFQVEVVLKRPAHVILAVRDDRGVIEEIQDEAQEHVAVRVDGTKALPSKGAYALRDANGNTRTHVIILACEKPVSDVEWFGRPKQTVESGPDLAARLERTRGELEDHFKCDVRLAPIPLGPP